MATYGVKDSLVRAVIAEKWDCVLLTAVLNLVHHKEESGPIMMYCFMGLFPDVLKIVYVWVCGRICVRIPTRSETQGPRSFQSWKFGFRDDAR